MSPFVPKLCGERLSGVIRINFPKSWFLRQRIGLDPFGFLQKSAVSRSDIGRRLMRCSVSGLHCDRNVLETHLLKRLGLTVERP